MKVSVTACFENDFHPFDCGGNPPCTLLLIFNINIRETKDNKKGSNYLQR
ncbi:hypothetical protein MTBBW1_1670021 [Desulfamplus magnetovallimortis]|uniref:Uncharacterized protein n=1 Tax=Desulfamplus magnetovallimortis TaxID=1246637 RepID=A0A1W1H9C0_9BACT|nr:hypothetical protein MTBBW1_1670021 [Desulfamplus magnetovallimortis]